jgi:hypothetical protein
LKSAWCALRFAKARLNYRDFEVHAEITYKSTTVGPARTARVLPIIRAIFLGSICNILRSRAAGCGLWGDRCAGPKRQLFQLAELSIQSKVRKKSMQYMANKTWRRALPVYISFSVE